MSAILEGLNEVQREAVTYGEGPMMILAGAGSGKTRVLTSRIAWLIEQGNDPNSIVAITFTNKAANEMKERVNSLLTSSRTTQDSITSKPYVGTFHALCVRILRRHSQQLGIPNNFSIYDETDANSLIKQAMKRFDIPIKKINPKAVKATISNAKNELVTPQDYASYARGYFQEVVAKLYPEYQRLLRENQALDFDDLLIQAFILLQEHEQVRSYYHQQWQYILIDEYQDTNKVQYALAVLLSEHNRNINVVGDAAQSIYAFRGADLRNVDQFTTDYPDAAIFNLEQNYRSTQKILDTATRIIIPNKNSHPVLTLWTENPEGEQIHLYEASSGSDEATYIVSEIQRGLVNYSYGDTAILYRTNSQSRQFEEALIRAGIPYRIIGGVKFYDRREIKDILGYLRLIVNPSDTVSYERVVNTPPRGIGAVTLTQGGIKLDEFHYLIDDFRKKAQELTVLELLDEIIEKIAYKDYIHDGTEEGISRWENIQELRSVASSFNELGPYSSTIAFLESVSLLEQGDVVSNDSDQVRVLNIDELKEDRVTLMTLHAAKGLEFPVVYLTGLEEGLLPHMRSLDSKFDIEEERRLCYVGVTRAMHRLHITYARSRTQFGSFTANTPSRFLKDIPMEHVEFIQAAPLFDQYSSKSWNFSNTEKKTWDNWNETDNYSLDIDVDFEPKAKGESYEADPLNKWEY